MLQRTLLVAGVLTAVLCMHGFPAGHARAQRQGSEPAERPALRQVSWDEASALVARFESALPPDLREVPPSERVARWPSWVESRRAAVAVRVAQGEDDAIINLLLFGTSFTKEPRVTPAFLADLEREWQSGRTNDAQQALLRVYERRASDLVDAIVRNRGDERLRLARGVLERRGFTVTTTAERKAAVAALLGEVGRVKEEAAAIAQALERAARFADPDAALAERSRAFRGRGLASDSTVLTQYAVDRALDAVRRGEILEPASVTRVAIVGPGLDFLDKQEGHDFYPPQSLQPFAVLDSIARAGLGRLDEVQVTTIDVSPRVNDHLRGAVVRARKDRAAYRLVLPFDTAAGWRDEAVAYWTEMGRQLGTAFEPAILPPLPGIRARGVAVDASHVARLQVLDGNIVFERADLLGGERFDIVIATNVLLYYEAFEQALALANIASMLRLGGVLVSNTALLEIPEIPMSSVGYATVPYSAGRGDGEHVFLYRRTPDPAVRRVAPGVMNRRLP